MRYHAGVYIAVSIALFVVSLAALQRSLFAETHRQGEHSTALLRDSGNVEESAGTAADADTGFPELMTPDLIARIESQASDALSPVHVHLLWIEDIEKVPQVIHEYPDKGYNLTIHTSAEEILDGFHPFVLKALNLAVPEVVGFDFLKLALLYKHGGIVVDADTSPTILASELKYPMECNIIFGKEFHLPKGVFAGYPKYRNDGQRDYAANHPYQLLNWAMAGSKPRNVHIKRLLTMAIMHFFGMRDMNFDLVQDIAGSGLMTDYMAMLHEAEGRNYTEVFDNRQIIQLKGHAWLTALLQEIGSDINSLVAGKFKHSECSLSYGEL